MFKSWKKITEIPSININTIYLSKSFVRNAWDRNAATKKKEKSKEWIGRNYDDSF